MSFLQETLLKRADLIELCFYRSEIFDFDFSAAAMIAFNAEWIPPLDSPFLDFDRNSTLLSWLLCIRRGRLQSGDTNPCRPCPHRFRGLPGNQIQARPFWRRRRRSALPFSLPLSLSHLIQAPVRCSAAAHPQLGKARPVERVQRRTLSVCG
jgi:hypothetical protein